MYENIRNINRPTFGETVINPIALAFTLMMGCLMLFLPRKYAMLPMIATACYITHLQRIVIGPADMDMIRLLLVFGFVRLFIRSEWQPIKWNTLDKLLIAYIISAIIMYTILNKTFSSFVYQLGVAFDALGTYFLIRLLLQDFDDFKPLLIGFAILSIPVALMMTIEQLTRHNLFSVFGGVPEITVMRDGKLRAQGAFSHPLMAGSFGAGLVALTWGLWSQGEGHRLTAIAGISAATVIVIACSSSGPILAYLIALVGLFAYALRRQIGFIWWLMVCMTITLQIFMNNPIWALLYRMTVLSSSTGWHRFALIDAAIRNFGEWWFCGTKLSAYWGWGLQDTTNQYVRVAIDGGILPLALFIMIIIFAFRSFGRSVRILEPYSDINKMIWAFGISLFTHAASFMSVSYFGQMQMIWYLSLATIAAIENQVELL